MGMPEKEGGGKGEGLLAGLELAERLPRKMGAGGVKWPSPGGSLGCGGPSACLSGPSTVFFSILRVASVQVLDDDRICTRPPEKSSATGCATSLSSAFAPRGRAQLLIPRRLGRVEI